MNRVPRKIAWLAWITLPALLAACGGAEPTAAPVLPTPGTSPFPTAEFIAASRFEAAPCPFALPEGYIQGQNVECGYLLVPENRSQPPDASGGRRAIRLAVAAFHPEGGARRPGALIYLAGGPGGSALELLRYAFDRHFAFILESGRELVLFDQRGVGRSRPALDCPAYEALGKDLLDGIAGEGQERLSHEQVAGLAREALLNCAASLRPAADLTAYNSAENAADVIDLARLLGYEQVDLWGVSYGTRLALEVLRLDPPQVRSVILDSTYPPDVDLISASPANAERAFKRLFESCASNPVCSASYPDLEKVLYDTIRRLDDEPASGVITDTLTGETYPALLTGVALQGLVFQILYDSDVRYLLPELIYDASQGDYAAINAIRGSFLTTLEGISMGMLLSVQCHDEVAFSDPQAFQAALAEHPRIARLYREAVLGGMSYSFCPAWGAGRAQADQNQAVRSDLPALILAGEFDPVTPPAWGQRAAQTLPMGFFFEYPGLGHGVSFFPGCPQEMLLDFLDDPTRPPSDDCIAGMGRPIGSGHGP